MRETLDYVTLTIAQEDDVLECADFDRATEHKLSLESAGTVIDAEGTEVATVKATRGAAGLEFAVAPTTNYEPEHARWITPGSFSPIQFAKAVAIFRSKAMEVSLFCRWKKSQNPEQCMYQVFTQQGLDAVRDHLRENMGPSRRPGQIIVETLLVQQPLLGSGITIIPLGAAPTTMEGPLVVPAEAPIHLEPFLYRVQLDYNLLCDAEVNDRAVFQTRDLGAVASLGAWLAEYPVRRRIFRMYLLRRKGSLSSHELRDALRDLDGLELELAGDALSKLDAASRSFQSTALDFLKEASRIRDGLTSTASAEFFKLTLTLVGLIAGAFAVPESYRLSVALSAAVLSVAIGVSGSYRLIVLEREFRMIAEVHEKLNEIESAAISDFFSWQQATHTKSKRLFYQTFYTGIGIIFTLLSAVAAAALSFDGTQFSIIQFSSFFILILLAVASLLSLMLPRPPRTSRS